MPRRLITIAVALFALAVAASEKPPQTIETLKARAESTTDKHKQIDLYLDLAKLELESANDSYNNNAEQARSLFLDSARSGDLAAQAALESNHRLKRTEIKLRELSHRMTDIRRTWAFEDRAPLDPAIQKIETARTKLLDRMFQK